MWKNGRADIEKLRVSAMCCEEK